MRHSADFHIESIDSVLQTTPNGATVAEPTGISSFYARYLKRPLDISAVILAAPIVLPLVILLAVVIWWNGDKPFYTQLRVGRSGRSFRLWKLRTMVENADLRLAEYLATNPEAKAEWDSTQKLKQDPRITKTGHFLRKTSLDELPQILNVLRGEMSIVGPRPHAPGTRAGGRPFEDVVARYAARHRVKPGLTGLAQVRGLRGETDTEDKLVRRVDADLEYIETWSVWQDMMILVRTALVVLRMENAH